MKDSLSPIESFAFGTPSASLSKYVKGVLEKSKRAADLPG